jgi:hypothetical protein
MSYPIEKTLLIPKSLTSIFKMNGFEKSSKERNEVALIAISNFSNAILASY